MNKQEKMLLIFLMLLCLSACAKKEIVPFYIESNITYCPRGKAPVLEKLDSSIYLDSLKNTQILLYNRAIVDSYIKELDAVINCYEAQL